MALHIQVEIAPSSRVDDILPHFRAYQKCYGDFAGATEQQTRDFLAELLHDPRSGSVVIALSDSRIVGFATAFVTVSGVLASRMIHLGDLYVLPEFRGQQIGERLIEAVRLEAARRDIPLVRWLSVGSNDRLNAWYETLGAKSYDFKLFIANAQKANKAPEPTPTSVTPRATL
jgi:GNAT superfamily N-acetyltransferase